MEVKKQSFIEGFQNSDVHSALMKATQNMHSSSSLSCTLKKIKNALKVWAVSYVSSVATSGLDIHVNHQDIDLITQHLFTIFCLPMIVWFTWNWFFLLVYAMDKDYANIGIRPFDEMKFFDPSKADETLWIFHKLFRAIRPYIAKLPETDPEFAVRDKPPNPTTVSHTSAVVLSMIVNYSFGLFLVPARFLDRFLLSALPAFFELMDTWLPWITIPGGEEEPFPNYLTKMKPFWPGGPIISLFIIYLVFFSVITNICGTGIDLGSSEESQGVKNSKDTYDLCDDPLDDPSNPTGKSHVDSGNGSACCGSIWYDCIHLFCLIIIPIVCLGQTWTFLIGQAKSMMKPGMVPTPGSFMSILILIILIFFLFGIRLISAISDSGVQVAIQTVIMYLFLFSTFGFCWYGMGDATFSTIYLWLKATAMWPIKVFSMGDSQDPQDNIMGNTKNIFHLIYEFIVKDLDKRPSIYTHGVFFSLVVFSFLWLLIELAFLSSNIAIGAITAAIYLVMLATLWFLSKISMEGASFWLSVFYLLFFLAIRSTMI